MGEDIISIDQNIIEQVAELQALCLAEGVTIATAESCTGGLLAYVLTEPPGSSAVYRGGVSAYSNEVKSEVLGVPEEVIKNFGAVSQQVASSMAIQCRSICSADIGVSLTGVAGPGGGTDLKPIGTVWAGISYRDQEYAVNLKLTGSRTEIRKNAVHQALRLLYDTIKSDATNGD